MPKRFEIIRGEQDVILVPIEVHSVTVGHCEPEDRRELELQLFMTGRKCVRGKQEG